MRRSDSSCRTARSTFEDRGRGTLRFFGAGRTYPATTDGHARLLFAATAVVVEGTGSLKGARGTLTISGEVTRPSIVSLTVVGRFDAGSPVDGRRTRWDRSSTRPGRTRPPRC